ncbi:MAG: hypothetical protein Q9210_001503 [Variospora velana]
MSFLKKYKKQFEDAKGKYMPEEKKTEDYAPTGSTPEQQHLTPAVPPGWVATWDAPNNRWTYLEQPTGRTQIEHPDPANYGGQSMPPGGPVLDKDGKPKKDKNGLLIGAAGGLATGAFGAKLMGLAKKKAGSLSLPLPSDRMGGHSSHGHDSHGHGSHGHGSHGHGGHGGHGGHEEEGGYEEDGGGGDE